MMGRETAICFSCAGERLHGVLHLPAGESRSGVLMIHGRPGYRVGAHRLFVTLARVWAEAGFAVMRFDYRGSGDSEGEMAMLEDTSADIAAAADALTAKVPGLKQIVLWSSCGGAADALLYAPKDRRVAGLALVNPWAYDAQARARMKLRHYAKFYLRLLIKPSGWSAALADLKQRSRVRSLLAPTRKGATDASSSAGSRGAEEDSMSGLTPEAARIHRSYRAAGVPHRLAMSLDRFKGKVLLILSGADLNARSFQQVAANSPEWRGLLAAERVRRYDIPGADHSFRRKEWLDLAAQWTLDWLRDL